MNETYRKGFLPMSLLSLGHFFSDFYSNFLPALLPIVIANMNLSLASSGILVMAFSFSSSVLQPVCGYILDKKAFTLPILLTLPISALFICTTNYLHSYWMLLLFLLISGLGCSIFHPLGSALLTKVTPQNKRGLALALFMSGGNLGFALAPIVLIYFVLQFGLSSLPFLTIPGLLLTLVYYRYDLHHIPLQTAVTARNESTEKWYQSKDMIKLNVIMALRAWPQVSIPTFLPLFMANRGVSSELAGSLLTVFLLGGAAGGFVGGYIGDRFGRKLCIAGLMLLCLPTLYLFITSEQISIATWICLALSGAAMQGVVPTSIVWAQDLLPKNGAMASGMMLGLSFGLGGLGAALTGYLADFIGLQSAFLWTLVPLTIAILLTFFVRNSQMAIQTKESE